ncbi:hypothetical protein TWF506_005716 [Arthrobotrys conoides]|uniref:Yeast cell wall synthesis Kre9/Knh1-like N-terminal domain-containing protein n=1 Tax=Arthrobotrys conoides TaxID=74498 RepID=A0AAN8P7C9_9PEZI
MRLKSLLHFLLSTIFITSVSSQSPPRANSITAPIAEEVLIRGEPFDIRWQNTVGASISLVLIDGPATQLREILTIATDISNTGSYTWTVPADLEPSGTYTIRISYDSNPNNWNYSDRFTVFRWEPLSSSVSSARSTSTSLPPPSPSSSSSSPSPSSSSISKSSTETSESQTSTTAVSSTSTSTTSSSSTTSTIPTSTNSSLPSESSGPNIGLIVGAVIGGVALVIVGGLIALWLVIRERRKRALERLQTNNNAGPRVLPDPNNQSIWDGSNVYSFNTKKETTDIFPGQDDPMISAGGVESGRGR